MYARCCLPRPPLVRPVCVCGCPATIFVCLRAAVQYPREGLDFTDRLAWWEIPSHHCYCCCCAARFFCLVTLGVPSCHVCPLHVLHTMCFEVLRSMVLFVCVLLVFLESTAPGRSWSRRPHARSASKVFLLFFFILLSFLNQELVKIMESAAICTKYFEVMVLLFLCSWSCSSFSNRQRREGHGIGGRAQARRGLRDVSARTLPHPGIIFYIPPHH